MQKIRHVYWFAYYDQREPSVRYRATYPLEKLKQEQGIHYTIIYPSYHWKTIFHFMYIFFRLLLFKPKESVLVFQKIYRKGIYTKCLKLLLFFYAKCSIYDTDDADYTRFPPEVINHFIKKSALCTVGSRTLGLYAQQFNPNVHLLSSPVIHHHYQKTYRNKTLTVGWIGFYNGHQENLKTLLFPALKELKFPICLYLLGVVNQQQEDEIKDYFKENENILIKTPRINWLDESSVYQHIAQFDIGVSPLLNTEFNRAKSAFKLKQCLSCGIPVLASPIGENLHFLEQGVNGYFCDNRVGFVKGIQYFYQLDDHKYNSLKVYARESLEEFDIDYYTKRLINILGYFVDEPPIKNHISVH